MKENRLYQEEPDYQRPLVHLSKPKLKILYEGLFEIYGRLHATEILDELIRMIEVHGAHRIPTGKVSGRVAESDRFPSTVIIQLSAKHVRARGQEKRRIHQDLQRVLSGVMTGFHFNGQYLSLSCLDDSWSKTAQWMADFNPIPLWLQNGVFARVSCHDDWFREHLNGNPAYLNFFLTFASLPGPEKGLESQGNRIQNNSAVTRFFSHAGERWVLTDPTGQQIGLNYTNPRVLLAVINRLLLRIRQGLDWIDLGDIDLHSPPMGSEHNQVLLASQVLNLLALVLQIAAPEAGLLITLGNGMRSWGEHLGNGKSKRLVRDPNLLPLVLWSMLSGEGQYLNEWLEKRRSLFKSVTFFNDLGERPHFSLESACDILPLAERQRLYDWVQSRGGVIEVPARQDELYFTWMDLFCPYGADNGADTQREQRFLATSSIPMALDGVSSLSLDEWLIETPEREHFRPVLTRMIQLRLTDPTFHSDAIMAPLALHPNVWALIRWAKDGQVGCLCLTNLMGTPTEFELDTEAYRLWGGKWLELITGEHLQVGGRMVMVLSPFEVRWYRCSKGESQEETSDEI